jgi:hypothetical protein
MIAERIEAARADLSAKSKEQIETETAATWGARAVVAYDYYLSSHDLVWLVLAIEYRHEALEHAAGGPPGTLEQIQEELNTLTALSFA